MNLYSDNNYIICGNNFTYENKSFVLILNKIT